MMTTYELLVYYANLLILQYIGKTKNYAAIETLVQPVLMPQTSVQTLDFSGVPVSGTFVLNYNGNATAAINWNDTSSTIQTKLRALTGLSSITVSGTIATGLLTITFTGVVPPAFPLSVSANTLLDSSGVAISITIDEIDETLPLAVQNAFNLIGSSTAVGAQLDVLGKYAGVTRSAYGLSGPITLNDTDFLTLIRLAIARNSSQSSLAAIQNLINFFFPGEILVFDYANMQMSYFVSETVGSFDLLQVVVSENLLPKPMGVGLGFVIFAPIINAFFGFQTYALWPLKVANNSPFNTYSTYNTNWPWLSYANAVIY